jgi:hypothetical protein
VRESNGGAGYGLAMLFNNLSHLIVNIEVGKRTEFICVFNLGIRYSEFLRQSRSLNIFVK